MTGRTISERAVERFNALRPRLDALRERHGRRVTFIFGLLSLLWGLVSGVLLKRDFAHSRQLVAYLALFVVASVLLRVWLEYAKKQTAHKLTGVRKFLLMKPELVTGAAHFATQCAVQYITMFCLPLLALSGAWTTLLLTAALAAITLFDPWWFKLANLPWCMAAIRSFVAVLAGAFALPVFFPAELIYVQPTLGVIAILASLPALAVTAGVTLAVVAQATAHTWLRVPLLSIWLQSPTLGTDVENHRLGDVWQDEEDREKIAKAAADDNAVCCFTPIVAPSGVTSPVTHEWLVDGSVVDRIILRPIRAQATGLDNQQAFRTFSCKHHLPSPTTIHALTCRVYLDDVLYLGKAEVSFY